MIGKYAARMDDKSRLIVPAKLRGELGDSFFVTLGVNCGHRCLAVYTAEEWPEHLSAGRGHQSDFHECRRVQP